MGKGSEVKLIFWLLTINNHVVSDDGGRVEGSFSWACCWETGTERCPEPSVHVKHISVVHPHAEPANSTDQMHLNEHNSLFYMFEKSETLKSMRVTQRSA